MGGYLKKDPIKHFLDADMIIIYIHLLSLTDDVEFSVYWFITINKYFDGPLAPSKEVASCTKKVLCEHTVPVVNNKFLSRMDSC